MFLNINIYLNLYGLYNNQVTLPFTGMETIGMFYYIYFVFNK